MNGDIAQNMTGREEVNTDKKVYVEVDMDSKKMSIWTDRPGDKVVVRNNVPNNVKLVFYDGKHSTNIKILKQ